MGYRRTQNDGSERKRTWADWLDTHLSELNAMGLPPEVYLDESRWDDFLQNGTLDMHEGTGWNFSELSVAQMQALGRFLDLYFAGDSRCGSLRAFIAERTKKT